MASKERIDKQHRYPWAVIETAVQLYFQQNMTFRSVSEKMLAHGVEVSHKTVYEWVQKFGDNVSNIEWVENPISPLKMSPATCVGLNDGFRIVSSFYRDLCNWENSSLW